MEMSLINRCGFEIVITAENVNIREDIEERIYPKKEDGKSDFSKPPKRDISDESMNQVGKLFEEMVYFREREFDSMSLIESLFAKLPQSSANKLLIKLNKEYEICPN